MGFPYYNDAQKVRIPLSNRAYIVMMDDMRVFCIDKPATFINTIIQNFHDQSRASLNTYLAGKRQELEELYADCDLEDTVKKKLIDHAVEKEREKTSSDLLKYRKQKEVSNVYHINNNNFDFLRYDCTDEDFYDNRPGAYIQALMEEYASLPFIKRERIFRRDVYEIVESACTNHNMLQVRVDTPTQQRQTFLIYPYRIVSDPLSTQDYLACYTCKPDEPVTAKIDASFAMTRLPKPKILKRQAFLSKADLKKIEKDINERSITYLLGEASEIHVRLTEKGKKLYQTRLYSRPNKDADKSKDDVYIFYCTELQAYYYFFPFGGDAEILQPASLRDKMARNYISAVHNYE